MASRTRLSDASTLELYRMALDNAEAQPQIAAAMAELGYDSKTISDGKAMLAETRAVYDLYKTEDDETSAAYAVFSNKKIQLDNVFTLHRKKAKVVFNDDPITADRLSISGQLPRTYINWLESAKKFYSVASSDTEIQSKLSRLKISADELKDGNKLITELELARGIYLKEKGESQNATKQKDAAISKLDKWMSEFYAVAKIALEDHPQLLEALGKTIRG
jgi:hypothetical protein